ncbi:diadenylate cyclase, partial [Aneurinibacillus sp. UBA3580]
RHRAAIGLSEVSDAIAVVVSEETGQVSVAMNGEITRDYDTERLTELLHQKLGPQGKTSAPLWQRKVKNDG